MSKPTDTTMPVARPRPRRFGALAFVAGDVRQEARSLRRGGPPGSLDLNLRRTADMNTGRLLGTLLDLHQRYGPVFQTRVLQHRMVFLVGARATAYVLLEHPERFHWRDGHLGQLVPLLGDGVLTTDAAYHDREARDARQPHRARRIALDRGEGGGGVHVVGIG